MAIWRDPGPFILEDDTANRRIWRDDLRQVRHLLGSRLTDSRAARIGRGMAVMQGKLAGRQDDLRVLFRLGAAILEGIREIGVDEAPQVFALHQLVAVAAEVGIVEAAMLRDEPVKAQFLEELQPQV